MAIDHRVNSKYICNHRLSVKIRGRRSCSLILFYYSMLHTATSGTSSLNRSSIYAFNTPSRTSFCLPRGTVVIRLSFQLSFLVQHLQSTKAPYIGHYMNSPCSYCRSFYVLFMYIYPHSRQRDDGAHIYISRIRS